MSLNPLSVLFPATGSFMSEEPALFLAQTLASGLPFVHTATNMRVEESRWTTRRAWVELKPADVAPAWVTDATQGAVWYNPRFGAGPASLSRATPGIVESAEGRLYRITPGKRDYTVEDISSGVRARPSMRIAWMAVGENYVIRTDGASLTQIYDGNLTVTSTGYNRNAPDFSRLPNFAGPVAYTDRFWIVDRERDVIAGDLLHEINQIDASDLLKTTNQARDITAKSFPPPANLGNINGMFVVTGNRGGGLPSQAEVMSATDLPATWGILGGTPRADWPNTPMCRIVHPKTGPTGPFAASAGRNELLMRTSEGITSLKYFDQDSNKPGNPLVNLGQEIKPILDADAPDLLLFASVINSSGRQRCGFSVSPRVKERHRWHRGFVTATFQPTRQRVPDAMMWEGVQTFPRRMGELVQFVEGAEFGSERIFAILRKEDGTKSLAEWTTNDGPDQLADGTLIPQVWQILTRRLTLSEYGTSEWGAMYMLLQDVRDEVTVKVSVRDRENKPFRERWCRTIKNDDWCRTGATADSEPIPMGKILDACKGPWIQLLIEGTGSCSVDVAIGQSNSQLRSDQGTTVNCLQGSSCTHNLFKRAE